jgi:tRNA-specific 2-thiouridylase
VLRLEPASRRVVVGPRAELARESCRLERVRWIPFDRPGGPLRAVVRIRSSHPGAAASIDDHGDGTATVRFDQAQEAVAPGQAAVAYDGDLVLGGGWIAA